jgi:lipopolysaccharide biosynthesis regulator YciM
VIESYWLLLLPLAAASGWWAARWDRRRESADRHGYDLPSAYFKGLNYLLNEQPDKAIEVFVKALEVDSETVETHLAVGSLFRRRGEVERATRIHQNLIARPNLDREQRSQALFELGQDYLKAGLFDRAESLFLELAEVHQHSEQALRSLLHIYQQEKEWEKAIAVSRKLGRATGSNMDELISQFYCELAQQADAAGEGKQAEAMIKRALASDRDCVRATMMLAHMFARDGMHADALKTWRRLEEQDAAYLGEELPEIAASFQALGDADGLRTFLEAALERHGGVALMLGLAEVVEAREGNRAAQRFVVDWLRRHASVHGLYRLIELKLAEADPSAQADLELLRGMIGRLLEGQSGYVCSQCGFAGKTLHWQCPGCKGWNTIRPPMTDDVS